MTRYIMQINARGTEWNKDQVNWNVTHLAKPLIYTHPLQRASCCPMIASVSISHLLVFFWESILQAKFEYFLREHACKWWSKSESRPLFLIWGKNQTAMVTCWSTHCETPWGRPLCWRYATGATHLWSWFTQGLPCPFWDRNSVHSFDDLCDIFSLNGTRRDGWLRCCMSSSWAM